MLADDKKLFLEWLTLLAESFNRKVSSLLLETYWQCLKAYPLAQVKQAMLNILQNPNRPKWGMPTPADLIILIQGDSHSHALNAWSQVVTAIRTIGRYDSVVFDNPIIFIVSFEIWAVGFIYVNSQKRSYHSYAMNLKNVIAITKVNHFLATRDHSKAA